MRLSLQATPNAADPLFSGQVNVTGARFSIGRAPDNDWVISDPKRTVSKRHCTVERISDGYRVVDGSTNGTSLNGRPVDRNSGQMLRDGDDLAIGHYHFKVRLSGAASDYAGDSSAPKITAILHDVAPAGVTATSMLSGFQDHAQPDLGNRKPAEKSVLTTIGWDGPPGEKVDVVKPVDILRPKSQDFVNRSEQVPTHSLRMDLPRPAQIIPDDWYVDPQAKPKAATAPPQLPEPIPDPTQVDKFVATPAVEPATDPAPILTPALTPTPGGVDRSAVIPVENIDVGGSYGASPTRQPEQPMHEAPVAPVPTQSLPARLTQSSSDVDAALQAFYDGVGVSDAVKRPDDVIHFFHNVGRVLAIAATELHSLQQAKTKAAALLELNAGNQASTPWIFSLSGEDQAQLTGALLALLAEAEPRELNHMRGDFQDSSGFLQQLSEAIVSLIENLQRGVSLAAIERQAGSGALGLSAFKRAAMWDFLVKNSALFKTEDGKLKNVELIELLRTEFGKT